MNSTTNTGTESGRLTAIPRPAWLIKSQWPFDTSMLKAGDLSIAVTDVGKGPVLLFVHTGQWSFVWREVMIRLSREFRCVCFDAPGTGLSPSSQGRAVTLEDASRATEAVIRGLDLHDITLVVHDLGGLTGIAGAARTPDRIRGIAAVNAFAWKPTGALFRGMLRMIGGPIFREFDVLTELIPRISSSSFGIGRHIDQAGRAVFRAGMKDGRVRAFHDYMRSALDSDPLYAELAAALGGPFRKIPLITIFGERNDPLHFQPHWKELYPSVRQVVVAKGNHYPMCDDPDLVSNSIREWHRETVAPLQRQAQATPLALQL